MKTVVEQVPLKRRKYTFRLHRRRIQMGEHAIDHWWMPITEIFRQKGSRHVPQNGGNHTELIEAAWALIKQVGSSPHPDDYQAYALAKLLPRVRSQASRKVVADSIPTRPDSVRGRMTRTWQVDELNKILRRPFPPLNLWKFSESTAQFIGPEVTTEEEDRRYRELESEMFPARSKANRETCFAQASAVWDRFTKAYGRRKGFKPEKRVMDMLSYEARAAMANWYSDVWGDLLLPHLKKQYALSPATQRFLKLWHTEYRTPSPDFPGQDFHLFHGTTFALHPAPGLFFDTAVGRELIGRWLSADSDDPAHPDYERLLGGLSLAVYRYSDWHDETKRTRSGRRDGLQMGGNIHLIADPKTVKKKSAR